jgi:hypothetical protein
MLKFKQITKNKPEKYMDTDPTHKSELREPLREDERQAFDEMTQSYHTSSFGGELWTGIPKPREASHLESIPSSEPDAYNRANFDQLVALQRQNLELASRPPEVPQDAKGAFGRLGRWMKNRKERKQNSQEISRYEAQLAFGIVGAALMYADTGKHTGYWK